MECNKAKAARAKETAEKRFKMKRFSRAKKYALKAHKLYPEIEGVSQMLATLDVYIAAENKRNKDVDWYGILNASMHDDNDMLKRKYKKLALMLHPDKNKFIGAEGAFKHVSDAWTFLSDKENRAAYDSRKKIESLFQKNSPNSRMQAQRKTKKKNPQNPVDHHTTTPKLSTFWRVCRRLMCYQKVSSVPSANESKLNTLWRVCRRCMCYQGVSLPSGNFRLKTSWRCMCYKTASVSLTNDSIHTSWRCMCYPVYSV